MTPVATILINATTKKITVRDTTPVDAVLFPPADVIVKGIGVIRDADGVIIASKTTYSNAFLTHTLGATTNGVLFDAPVDDAGEVVQGEYQLEYGYAFQGNGNIAMSGGVVAGKYVILGKNFTELLLPGSSFAVTGFGTGGNNGVKTIVASTLVGSDTHIEVSGSALTNEAAGVATFVFATTLPGLLELTQSYLCDLKKASVSVDFDCDYGMYGRLIVKNTSDFGDHTVILRSWSVAYPQELTNPDPNPSPVTATNVDSVTITKIAEGWWAHTFKVNLEYVQEDLLVVAYTAESYKQFAITCTGFLCSIRCCYEHIIGLSEAEISAYGKSKSIYTDLLNRLNVMYIAADMARKCGKRESVQTYVQKMHDLIQNSGFCSDDCGCDEDSDTPRWIDNSGFEAQDLLEQLIQDMADMQSQVNGLEQVVQNNADALEAYSAIMEALAAYNADLVGILAQVSQIQSTALGLDANSPTFEDDVDQIEAWLLLVESALGDTVTELNGIVTLLNDFNTNFPEYLSYTINIADYLTQSQAAATEIQNAIDALQLLLGALTPSTYLADIAAIWAAITELSEMFENLNNLVNLMYAWLQDIQTVISNIYGDLLALTVLVNNLIAQFNAQSKIKLLGCYVEDTDSANLFVPADWLNEKVFYKINIKGVSTQVGAELKFTNTNTSITLIGVVVGNNTYDIDFDMRYYPADGVWKIGGTANVGGTLTAIENFAINTTTELPLEVDTVIQILSSGAPGTNTFYAIDGIAYKY